MKDHIGRDAQIDTGDGSMVVVGQSSESRKVDAPREWGEERSQGRHDGYENLLPPRECAVDGL